MATETRCVSDDLEIQHLALENLELRDRVADLEVERDSYRELLQRSLDALNSKIAEFRHQDRRLSEQRQTIAELRELLSHLSAEQAAA